MPITSSLVMCNSLRGNSMFYMSNRSKNKWTLRTTIQEVWLSSFSHIAESEAMERKASYLHDFGTIVVSFKFARASLR